MPKRTTILVNNNYYHVYNRGLNRQPTFTNPREYRRALTALAYYKYQHPNIKLSKFLALDFINREALLKSLASNGKYEVSVLAYCLMPNHFHLLLKQLEKDGISHFLSNFQNSYTKYFNSRHNIQGGLFTPRFKASLIETDEQLLHVSRYIHLNPYTSSVVKKLEDVENYPYSSYREYVKEQNNSISNPKFILSFYKNIQDYKNFVLNHADYQKKLKLIRHLLDL